MCAGFIPVLAACLGILPFPANAAGLLFSLVTERQRFLIGEPVYLRIESDLPVAALEDGAFILAIQGESGPERIYHPPLRYRGGGAPIGKPVSQIRKPGIAAGAAVGGDPRRHFRFARLICADGQLLFGKPGRYRLRLASPQPDSAVGGAKVEAAGAALSASISIAFSEPSSQADKLAYAVLSRNPREYGLAMYLEGGDQLREGMAIISELAATQSAYTRAAAFVLSSDWSQDFRDYQGPGSRSLDLQKAMAWAQWDMRAGWYIPLKNAYRLASGLEAHGNAAMPGSDAAKRRISGFLAGLSPSEKAWYQAL